MEGLLVLIISLVLGFIAGTLHILVTDGAAKKGCWSGYYDVYSAPTVIPAAPACIPVTSRIP